MKIVQKEDRIVYENDTEIVASLIMKEHEGVYDLLSTYVSPTLRGQGIASKLMDELIVFLKARNATCVPICSYTVSWFENHPEYQIYVA